MRTFSKSLNILMVIVLALSLGLQDVGPALADGPADQAISVDTSAPATAAYGQGFTVAATASSGLDVTYTAAGSCTNVGATFTMTDGTGTCTVQYDQPGDVDFNPAPQVTEQVSAQPVAITVTADGKSKTYGQSDPALTYVVTNGALVGTDDFTGALTRDPGETVGDYAITQGTLALNANYALTYVGANLTVGQEPITVTADARSKHVGDADPALTYSITSGALVGTDDFTGALTRDPGETVGDYAITQGTLALSANYALTYVGANLSITDAPLITISGNAGVAGATLSYTDGTPQTATADGTGHYSFTVSYNWSGTVTLSEADYSFTPANTAYTNLLTDQTHQDYIATPVTFTISGNAGVAGATLSYTDGAAQTATADGTGHYSFTVSYNWSGTVTPGMVGYNFTPLNKVYTNVLADQTGQDYSATAITFTISGNAGIGGATLSYTDGTAQTATANSSGDYSIVVSYNWSGTVIPSRAGFSFLPVNKVYSQVTAAQTAQNYVMSGTWFVATNGLDSNGCNASAAPCLTIGTALGKAASGDTIMVANGTYVGSGAQVVQLSKNTILSGGWNGHFLAQNGVSIIDGQDGRADVVVNSGVVATIDNFSVINSMTSGINNLGTLTVQRTLLYNNNPPVPANGNDSRVSGGGIYNSGALTVLNSAIHDNFANGQSGGGIYNAGALVIKDTTIAQNSATNGGGLMYTPTGHISTAPSMVLNNVTLSANNGFFGGGIYRADDIGAVHLAAPVFRNSILAKNISGGAETNCHGLITSANNNIMNTNINCTIGGRYQTADPLLGSLVVPYGFMPMSTTSPAIDAGSPLTPGSGGAACETADQLGTLRPVDGNGDSVAVCDIGAYEWHTPIVHTISGNAGVAGAALSYEDLGTKTVTSDSNGNYSLVVSAGWAGIVTPVKLAYVFSPPSVDYSVSPGPVTTNLAGQDYVATRTGVIVSGNVGVPNVTLSYLDGFARTAVSDSNGNYSLSVPNNWSGTLTPSKTGYRFVPLQMIYSNLVADQLSQNYTAYSTYPTIVAPKGFTSLTTPTFIWGRVVAATQYRFELLKKNKPVYSRTILSTACGASSCSNKPTTVLAMAAYTWRVQAMINGTWRDFGPAQAFTVAYRPGLWTGFAMRFYVTSNWLYVHNFSINVYVPGCGAYKITQTSNVPISNFAFSFTGPFYASGKFTSRTAAKGTLGLSSFYLAGCGYVSGGPFSWTSSWINSSQAASVNPATVTPLQGPPPSDSSSQLFTLERLDP